MRPQIKKIAKKAINEMKAMFGGQPVIDDDEAEMKFNQSFGGLKNRTLYWDPANYRGQGHINLRKDIYDHVKSGLQESDNMIGHGFLAQFNAYQGEMRKKALLSSSWNIPIHAIPKVTVVTPGILPLANLMARMTFNRDSLQTTPLTTIGAAAHFAESATSYTENDDTYHNGTESFYTFSVDGYGRANKISNLMNMVGGAIQNPRNTNAMSQYLAVRRYEEKQIFQGQNGGDASGFTGFYEAAIGVGAAFNTDKSGGIDYVDDITDGIENLISNGADPDAVAIFTDQYTHQNVIHALRDYVRTGSAYKTRGDFTVQAPGVDIRLRPIDFDGTPIMKSFGAPTTTGSREIVFVDMSKFYMAMVQDASLKPLASTGPYEFAATDAYGMLVNEGRGFIGRYYGIV